MPLNTEVAICCGAGQVEQSHATLLIEPRVVAAVRLVMQRTGLRMGGTMKVLRGITHTGAMFAKDEIANPVCGLHRQGAG